MYAYIPISMHVSVYIYIQHTYIHSGSMEWSKIVLDRARPPGRHSHAMVIYNNDVYIFGGRGSGGEALNDVWIFSTDINEWEMIETGGGPSGRYYHTGVINDNCLYVFGGFNSTTCFNELWLLNLDTHVWKRVAPSNNIAPCKRYGHIACIRNDDMFVLGGMMDQRTHLNDMWRYNMSRNVWSEVEIRENCRRSARMR